MRTGEDGFVEVWQTWDLHGRTGPSRPAMATRVTHLIDAGHAADDAASAADDAAPPQSRIFRGDPGSAAQRYDLQRARIDRRWSVTELAERSGCDPASVAAYERGDGVITDDVHRRLRAAMAEGSR